MTKEEAIEIYNGLTNPKIKEAFEFFVPELTESDDEKIRKAIILALRGNGQATAVLKNNGVYWEDAITWLEKQKDEVQKQFNLGVQAGREEVMYEIEKEQKPAEWSEDDEIDLDDAIKYIQNYRETSSDKYTQLRTKEIVEWLKSLRPQPHWKPNEEQMSVLCSLLKDLKKVYEEHPGTYITYPVLFELYEQLKQLL